MRKPRTKGTVYSTDTGQICPGCGHPVKQCRCAEANARPAGDGVVRVSRQTKGRKGNGVSLITGVLLPEPDLKILAKELKRKCGSGGTVKDGVIEIQGDHRLLLVDILQKMGYTTKMAGG